MKISVSDRLAARLNVATACAVALACGLLCFAPAASAQQRDQPPAPTAADKETARGLMREGRAKEAAGDYAGALDSYEAADLIMGLPSTGLSVGKMRVELGKLVEARTVLLRVARYRVRPTTPPPLVKARGEALALAEALVARIPSLQLDLPEGLSRTALEITVDGEALAPALLGHAQRLDPGVHEVGASHGASKLFTREVTLAEGARETLQIEVDRDRLKELSEPAATPPPAPITNRASVPDSARTPATAPDHAEAAGVPGWTWIGFAVGGAGLVVGGVAGLVALVRTNDLRDACPGDVCPADQRDLHDDATLAAHVSTAGFVTAAVGSGVGVIGLLTAGEPAKSSPRAGMVLEPVVGPLGVALRGRF